MCTQVLTVAEDPPSQLAAMGARGGGEKHQAQQAVKILDRALNSAQDVAA